MVKIKFNGGKGALLCENCNAIIATGYQIPAYYRVNSMANEYVFCCEECKAKFLKKMEARCYVIEKKG